MTQFEINAAALNRVNTELDITQGRVLNSLLECLPSWRPLPHSEVYPCSLDPKQELQRKWNNSYLHVAVVSVLDIFFKKVVLPKAEEC